MVRTRTRLSETVAKVAAKKQPSSTITAQQTSDIWICEINDCGKRFVREADLKRHQNTSKAHRDTSQPVCCPQCDSTFTRTDALKRHQRSRHSGNPSDHAETQNSTNRSRRGKDQPEDARSPRTTGQSSETKSDTPPPTQFSPIPTVVTQPEGPGRPTDTQSYYGTNGTNMVKTVFIPPITPCSTADMRNIPKLPISFPVAGFHSWIPHSPIDAKQKTAATAKSRSGLLLPQPIPISRYVLSDYQSSDAYYRTSYAPPVTIPPNMATMQIDPSLLAKFNDSEVAGDNTTPPSSISPILNLDKNTDSRSPVASAVTSVFGTKSEHGHEPKLDQTVDPFPTSGFSPDVRDALTAVLSFDATGGIIQRSDQNEKECTLPIVSTVSLDQQASCDTRQNDLTLPITDNAPNLQSQEHLAKERSEDTETISLPDGIRELLNEDTFSYVSTS